MKNIQFNAFHLIDQSSLWGEGLWELVFDLPEEKVNKLSQSVMSDFEMLLSHLESEGSSAGVKALILTSGKPQNFIAGADIKMFEAAQTAEAAQELSASGQTLFNRWEDLSFIKIAAVMDLA